MSATEKLLTEILEEIRGMRADLHGIDIPIVNRLTQVIEELELLRGVKEELDAAHGPRLV